MILYKLQHHLKLMCRPLYFTEKTTPKPLFVIGSMEQCMKAGVLDGGRSEFQSWLHCLLGVQPWLSYFISLTLTFLVKKITIKKGDNSTHPVTSWGLNSKCIQNAYHITWGSLFGVMEMSYSLITHTHLLKFIELYTKRKKMEIFFFPFLNGNLKW